MFRLCLGFSNKKMKVELQLFKKAIIKMNCNSYSILKREKG